jgi:hypothetical protein
VSCFLATFLTRPQTVNSEWVSHRVAWYTATVTGA